MSLKQPIIKAKIHSANTAMNNEEFKNLSNPATANAVANATITRIEKKQEEIDYYNSNTIHKIDPMLSAVQLAGKSVVIRLHKENYIKGVSYYADGLPLYDAWFSQVDGRVRRTDPEKWVDSPLPYVFSGVVVAISPLAKADYNKEVEVLRESGIETKALEVGDIVYLEHFNFQDKRFYLNKQARDFIKNPEEFRIEHFEGYVKIHPTMIECIVDKKNFNYNSSPYLRHKAYEASKTSSVEG